MAVVVSLNAEMSFFRARQFYTLNEGFLGEEKGNDDRYRKDRCSSHELVPDERALTLEIL